MKYFGSIFCGKANAFITQPSLVLAAELEKLYSLVALDLSHNNLEKVSETNGVRLCPVCLFVYWTVCFILGALR